MACPGGCIGGGGQPYPPEDVKVLDPELLRKRAGALYAIDKGKTLRKSYENPAIEELYDKFLGGPGSEKAHDLLHTHYQAKLPARHSMSTTTDNWEEVQADGQGRPDRADRAIHRAVPPAARAGQPADRRAAQGAGPFRLPRPEQLDAVAQLLQVPAAKVAGVASFYHFFRLQPARPVHHQRLPGHGLLREGRRPRGAEE